jgi:hypothetical protein
VPDVSRAGRLEPNTLARSTGFRRIVGRRSLPFDRGNTGKVEGQDGNRDERTSVTRRLCVCYSHTGMMPRFLPGFFAEAGGVSAHADRPAGRAGGFVFRFFGGHVSRATPRAVGLPKLLPQRVLLLAEPVDQDLPRSGSEGRIR